MFPLMMMSAQRAYRMRLAHVGQRIEVSVTSSLTRADLASDQKDVEWIAAMVDGWSNSAGTRGAEIRL